MTTIGCSKEGFRVILIGLLFSFNGCVKGPLHSEHVRTANLKFVNLYITTSIGVDCSEMRSYFGDRLQERSVQDVERLETLVSHLNRIIVDDNLYDVIPDSRVRIELLDSDFHLLATICVGSVSLSYNDQVYLIDDEFRDFLVVYLDGLK